jgi:triacylglycerol lipase
MPAREPILLVHGIARFDILRELTLAALQPFGVTLDDSTHYFRGIQQHLVQHGFDVRYANVSFAARMAVRSRDLGGEIDRVLRESKAGRVHLIAHSMGGLDARHLIVQTPGMAAKVASLTTIGTPHHGTTYADVALDAGGNRLVDMLGRFIELEGFRDLTTTACREFNRHAEAAEALNPVRYQVCASNQVRDRVFLPMQASWAVIHEREGENDGLVSVASQNWCAALQAGAGPDAVRKPVRQIPFPLAADHLGQVGWWNPNLWRKADGLLNLQRQIDDYERQVRDFYLGLANGLAPA